MNPRLVATAIVMLALLAAGGWWWRGTVPVRAALNAVGLSAGTAAPTTTETLHAAGVHKCRTADGILYVDAACPKGSREMKAVGGTVTVMPVPLPAPALPASAAFGGPPLKPMDREERDRLRGRQVEDAANRP